MICYRDRTFCISPGCTNECGRKLTAEVRAAARAWWGGDDAPIAMGYFCGGEPQCSCEKEVKPHPFTTGKDGDKCGCRACRRERYGEDWDLTAPWFVVCETCGNKRCPHATDHRNGCTNSNEPGQKGSAYE